MKSLKNVLAATTAAALAFAGLLGVTTAANAADPYDINTNTPRSLVIHKHETPAAAAATGQEQTVTSPTIDGVEFTIQKINIDLTNPANWSQLDGLTPAQAAGMLTGSPIAQTTTGGGVATFSNLEIAAYLVKETNAPANVTSRAADFIVTVPYPNDTAGWLYNVHVYPKNSVSAKPTKTVDDSAAVKAGDPVTWTITQTMPTLATGEKFTALKISDVLDSRLNYQSAVVKVNGTPVTTPAPVYTAGTRELVVEWDATAAGTLNSGDVVTVEVKTEATGAGVIPNEATVFISTPSGNTTTTTTPDDPTSPGTPGTPPSTSWGYFNVNKVEAGADTKKLAGAEFELYTDAACTAANKVNIPVAQMTTAANGAFAAPVLVKAGTYYLKETKAPLGYVASGACTEVVVAATNLVDSAATLKVENPKAIVPGLPLTGSQGQAILLGLGALLVVAGGTAVVARRAKA